MSLQGFDRPILYKMSETITLTFSESVENHTGMQIIGKKSIGFFGDECRALADKFEGRIYEIGSPVGMDACFVVFKNGLSKILGVDAQALKLEQSHLEKDMKAFMYGRVVNKKARYNLCFADFSQSADYEKKMGTIVNFKDLPELSKVRKGLYENFGDNFKDLFAEGNYYYDVKKCYIGYHGDTERSKVVGVRLGADFPLHFRWHRNGDSTDYKKTIKLEEGDIYIMSEKTTGNDWKKRNVVWTLRHAAGDEKWI
jgi:hypothetical protein